MGIHLIMPMGGAGSRFYKDGYMIPKPLIEIEEKPFFYWAAQSIFKFVDVKDITFVVLRKHVEKFDLYKKIKNFFPDANVIIISEVTPGPVFTCLDGIRNISDKAPLLFNDCDHMFKCSKLNEKINEDNLDLDGALVTFESTMSHFSYVQYNEKGDIIGTAEKEVVSNHAICGAYYYKSAEIFRVMAEEYLRNCPYKESFLSGMYNVMCKHNMKIKDFLLDFHVEFGTPEEYKKARGSEHFKELI